MRVLVLGVAGMLGHKVFRTFTDAGVDTWGTLRQGKQNYKKWPFLQSAKVVGDVDVTTSQLQTILNEIKPQFVINCVGLTIRKENSSDERANIKLNALLPHEIEFWCRNNNAKLLHYSTDHVFNGQKGDYTEESPKDAADVYGQSKSLGEVNHSEFALTLRSSIIGRELDRKTELLEWFLAHRGKSAKGYTRSIYSGVTTNYLAELSLRIVKEQPKLSGLLQPTSVPISKFELLKKINATFRLGIELQADDKVVVNNTLLANKFNAVTGWTVPAWDQLVDDLARDSVFYDGEKK